MTLPWRFALTEYGEKDIKYDEGRDRDEEVESTHEADSPVPDEETQMLTAGGRSSDDEERSRDGGDKGGGDDDMDSEDGWSSETNDESDCRWGKERAERTHDEKITETGSKGVSGGGEAQHPDAATRPSEGCEAVNKTVLDISTHEEIINLIRAGASESEWEAIKERERDRIEESRLRWKTMKFAMQDEGKDADDEKREESPPDEITETNRSTLEATRKRERNDEEELTAHEHVLGRSNRVKKESYKAGQPEFARFMRRTVIASEKTKHVRTRGGRLMTSETLSLFINVNPEASSERLNDEREDRQSVLNDQRWREGIGGQNDRRRSVPDTAGTKTMAVIAIHEDIGDEKEECTEMDNNGGKRGGDPLASREDQEDEKRLSNTSVTSKAGQNTRQREESIKERRIGPERLTNLELSDRYWNNGRLRPHTSLYIEASSEPMHIPPTPYLPQVYLPATSQTYEDYLPTTQEKLYPPHGLVLPWSGLVLVGTNVDGMYKRVLTLGAKGNLPSGYIVSLLWVLKQFAWLIPSR